MHTSPSSIFVTHSHLLFSPDQVFLWLPGLSGDETAFCTYNREVYLAEERMKIGAMFCDERGACFVPPYPISRETHIMWDTHVSPPFPYHPVPIIRSLSREEMDQVAFALCDQKGLNAIPAAISTASILRNDCKCEIMMILSQLGLLQGSVPASCQIGKAVA